MPFSPKATNLPIRHIASADTHVRRARAGCSTNLFLFNFLKLNNILRCGIGYLSPTALYYGLVASAFSSTYGCDMSIGRLAQIAAAVPGECVVVGLEEAQGLLVEVGR